MFQDIIIGMLFGFAVWAFSLSSRDGEWRVVWPVFILFGGVIGGIVGAFS